MSRLSRMSRQTWLTCPYCEHVWLAQVPVDCRNHRKRCVGCHSWFWYHADPSGGMVSWKLEERDPAIAKAKGES